MEMLPCTSGKPVSDDGVRSRARGWPGGLDKKTCGYRSRYGWYVPDPDMVTTESKMIEEELLEVTVKLIKG